MAEDFKTLTEGLYHVVPKGIFTVDSNRLITSWNDEARDITGYTKEEVLGKDCRLFTADLCNRTCILFNAHVPMPLATKECSIRTKNGEVRRILKNADLLTDDQGKIIGGIEVFEDITHGQESEKALIGLEAQKEANRIKTELVTNMDYGIKAPMSALIDFIELVLADKLPQEQRERLEMVQGSPQSLLHLLTGILYYSLIRSGNFSLQPCEFNLREFLDHVAGSLVEQAESKEVTLHCRIDPRLPKTVKADQDRLREVLVNLLENAMKFTEKGEVSLQAERANTATGAPEPHGRGVDGEGITIHFSVRDTGMGIPRRKQEIIFNAFAQGDGPPTGRLHGIGLGLAISAQLVELMGGSMWLESEEGRGSIFHFTTQVGCHEGDTGVLPKEKRFRQTPVLLVGGSHTSRSILREILEPWGLYIRESENEKTALAIMYAGHAMGRPFRLLVIDSSITISDTMEFINRVKLSPNLSPSEVIFLVSPRDKHDIGCRELGRTCKVVRKPVVESRLLDAVRAALGQAPPVATHPKEEDTRHHPLDHREVPANW